MSRPTGAEITAIKARLPLGGQKKIVEELIAEGMDFGVKVPSLLVHRVLSNKIGHKTTRQQPWDERHDAVIRKAREIIKKLRQ